MQVESGAQTCADTWASGAQVLDVCHIPWPTDALSCLTILGRGHHTQRQSSPRESGEEEGKATPGSRCRQQSPLGPQTAAGPLQCGLSPRGGTSQGSPPSLPFPVCGCHSSSHCGMKRGTQTVSQSGTVTMLLADTQATTHSRANCGVSSPRAVARPDETT